MLPRASCLRIGTCHKDRGVLVPDARHQRRKPPRIQVLISSATADALGRALENSNIEVEACLGDKAVGQETEQHTFDGLCFDMFDREHTYVTVSVLVQQPCEPLTDLS
jgi:hypothetical protein